MVAVKALRAVTMMPDLHSRLVRPSRWRGSFPHVLCIADCIPGAQGQVAGKWPHSKVGRFQGSGLRGACAGTLLVWGLSPAEDGS